MLIYAAYLGDASRKDVVRSRRLGNDEKPLDLCLRWVDYCRDGGGETSVYAGGIGGSNSPLNPLEYSKFVLQDNEQGQIRVSAVTMVLPMYNILYRYYLHTSDSLASTCSRSVCMTYCYNYLHT